MVEKKGGMMITRESYAWPKSSNEEGEGDEQANTFIHLDNENIVLRLCSATHDTKQG